jgi:hypothetical protein
MPFSSVLGSFGGRPLPSARRGHGGMSGSTLFHCSSVRSIGQLTNTFPDGWKGAREDGVISIGYACAGL